MKPVETIENIGSCDIGESPANFRRYVAGLLSASAIWLLALLGINIGVDPFADFYFLTGRRQPSVYTLDSYADMKFKVGRVREAGLNGVGVAVFGSSRVMRIDPADAAFASGPGCALNLGVQGGNLPQAIQFVDFVLSRNPECTPIVGLDLFAFDTRRNAKSIYLDEAAPSAARIDTLSRLASNETFTTSLAMLRGRKATNSLLPSGLAVKPPPNPVARQAILDGFFHQPGFALVSDRAAEGGGGAGAFVVGG